MKVSFSFFILKNSTDLKRLNGSVNIIRDLDNGQKALAHKRLKGPLLSKIRLCTSLFFFTL